MKIARIQAGFLVFVLIMPLVFTSITTLGDPGNKYDLCENFPEEERKGDRGSGEKEGKGDFEEFMFHEQHDLATLEDKNSKSLSRNNELVSIGRNVLTPPPEFI